MSAPDFAHDVPGAHASVASSSRRKGAPSRIATLGAGLRGLVQNSDTSTSSARAQRSPLQQVHTFEHAGDEEELQVGGDAEDPHVLSSFQAIPLQQPPTFFPRREASLQGNNHGLPSASLPSAASSSTSFGSALPVGIPGSFQVDSGSGTVPRPTPPRLHRAYSEGQGVPDHLLPEAPSMAKGLSEGLPRDRVTDVVTRSRRSGSVGDLLYAKDSMEFQPDADYVIAVVGAQGVGKTTVIKRAFTAWGLSEPKVLTEVLPEGRPSVSSSRATVETGTPARPRSVEILELDLSVVFDSTAMTCTWPTYLPKIDGVMVCYDAQEASSIDRLPGVLGDLCSSIPSMLIACKSDPGVELAISPFQGNDIGHPYQIGLVELSMQVQEGRHKMRMAFSWLLKTISKRRRQDSKLAKSLCVEASHRGTSTAAVAPPSSPSPPARPGDPSSSSLARDHIDAHQHVAASTTLDSSAPAGQKEAVPADSETSPKPVAEAKLSLDTLLHMLLEKVMSGTEAVFVNSFFLLHRRFCNSSSVLDAILAQWRIIQADNALEKQHRLWFQMRLATAVAQWLRVYPGDFAASQMQTAVYTLLEDATSLLPLAHILEDVAIGLAKVDGNDPDATWSRAVEEGDRQTSLSALLLPPATASSSASGPISPASYSDLDDSTLEAIASNLVLDQNDVLKTENVAHESLETPADPASSSTSDLSHVTHVPSLPSSGQYSSQRESSDGSRSFSEPDLAESRAYARALALFEELPDTAIAMELTQLEYEHFRAIRPRDCLCQVLGDDKPASLAGSVQHFNDISAWASTMVLLHSKARRRAKVLERLASIMHQLYRLKNYATLWSVASGIRDSSVMRLTATMAQVSRPHLREIDIVSKVIDPIGSYSTYRQLLQDDGALGSRAIPFIGVVTNDLAKIAAANKDDQDDINGIKWQKYEVMAEAVAPVALFQARGSPVEHVPVSTAARALIADTPRLDEEALYQRSQYLEPGQGVMGPGAQSGAARFKRMMSEGFKLQQSVPEMSFQGV